jgi:hypothetical protein
MQRQGNSVHAQEAPVTEEQQTPMFAGVVASVNRVVSVAGSHLAPLVEQSQPTPNLLKAIAEELSRAVVKPKSVKAGRRILAEAAEELKPAVSGAERELQAWVNFRAFETAEHRAVDPHHTREVVVDEIAQLCQELHEIIVMVSVLRPPLEVVDAVQADLDDRRRKEAAKELQKTHSGDQLRDAVLHREAELRAEVPWRHQDLAIEAHRLVRETLGGDVDDMIEVVTQPILAIGERAVQLYDMVTTQSATRI